MEVVKDGERRMGGGGEGSSGAKRLSVLIVFNVRVEPSYPHVTTLKAFLFVLVKP
jgi:hypothetical protein